MRLVDSATAETYLRETRRIEPDERVCVRELSGGVSNIVLLVERPDRGGADFVLKQARARLRTRQAWFADVERAWREADVLAHCARLLDEHARRSPACTKLRVHSPRIVFEDRENYLLAITAAPRPNRSWKEDLLAGRVEPQIARACGRLLATLHGESWLNRELADRLGDRSLFEQLRVDPYYRTLAKARPETAGALARLIASLEEHPRSLVHADFSPKNLLVFSSGLMMVDFETGHFGDPAFDLGFFLSHLVLKACHHAPRHAEYLGLSRQFYESYDEAMAGAISTRELSDLWARGVQNFAACAWARLDGKSPVEYLSDSQSNAMRALCRTLFEAEPRDWPSAVDLCERAFAQCKGPQTRSP
jgi:5-methylthioribose kinase